MGPGTRWWRSAREIAEAVEARKDPGTWDWYLLGNGFLGISSDYASFRKRFRQLYGECRAKQPTPGCATVRCRVFRIRAKSLSFIRMKDDVALDAVGFVHMIFPDRKFYEQASPLEGWRLLADREGPVDPFIAFCGDCALAPEEGPWQSLVGSLAVNRLFRLQSDVLFFHGATVSVGGQGVLLAGPKASGKTTISLALAARGHVLLGDETAAVNTSSTTLLPMRRSVSVRTGPRAATVDGLLRTVASDSEVYPDGTSRLRVQVGDLFPGSQPSPAPLRHAFLMRSFGDQPRVESFSAGLRDLDRLGPLGCSLWRTDKSRMIHFFQLLSRIQCHFVDVGSPDDTAALIEKTVEGS
jgi:hypothetical protein